MPNVPQVPGVPLLASYSANLFVLLLEDTIAALLGFSAPVWGIFFEGAPVIIADNQVSFEFKQDFPVSDYPVEEGGFQSYDKVQLPIDVRCRFSAGGDEANRQAFLASIDAVMNTTDLYDVVTPEAVYESFNFTHRDWRRSAQNGMGLIQVDVWLQEIRESSVAAFQNTQTPAVAGQQGVGNVQPTPPSAAIQSEFSAAGGSN